MYTFRRYDWILHLAAIAFCSYFLAQIVTTYTASLLESGESEGIKAQAEKGGIRPLDRGGPSTEKSGAPELPELDDFKVIAERNIFNAAESGLVKEVPVEEMGPERLGELGPAVKTGLDIKVLGLLSVGEGTDRRSSVVVSGGKEAKKAETYYPADEKSFAPNVKLIKVLKDRIEFINGPRMEFAELEDIVEKKNIFASAEEVHGRSTLLGREGETSTPASGGKIVVDQREIDDALQNLDRLMTEIRIVPNFVGGKPAGMKVLSVRPGSIITKLGIQRGDVLEKVNGQDLDIRRGMDLFNQMRDMRSFALDVSRGGKNQTLEYEIR